MPEPPFAELTCFCIHKANLLEARMIVTTYNHHVRLLSSEPFGWFAPPKSTRAWEPTLLWNHYTQYKKPPTFAVRCESSHHDLPKKSAFMSQEKYIGMDVHQATISVAVMDRVAS